MNRSVCCIVGCSQPACEGVFCQDEAVCLQHLQSGSPNLFKRLKTARRRQEAIDKFWFENDSYNAVVRSDRYLKLCTATQEVMDQVQNAWTRFKLDLILKESARGSRQAPDVFGAAATG